MADEDDEMSSYNVRSAAIDMAIVHAVPTPSSMLIADQRFEQAAIETQQDPGLSALQTAFGQVAQTADTRRSQSDEDWWKGYESALAVVGGISEDLIEHVQERAEEKKAPKFALEGVFQGVVMTYLTASGALSSTRHELSS